MPHAYLTNSIYGAELQHKPLSGSSLTLQVRSILKGSRVPFSQD